MDATMVRTGVLLALLALAAWQDLRRFRIANPVTFGGAALGLALAAALPGTPGVLASLAGWLVGLLILLPFHALRMMGAGDAKLLAMVGAFTGPTGVALIALFTFIAGGLLALLVVLGGGRLQVSLRRMPETAPATAPDSLSAGIVARGASRLPYGVAILLGSVAWLGLAVG